MSIVLILALGKEFKSEHGSYKWIIMLEKCGRPDLNVFHLKWIIDTHGKVRTFWETHKIWKNLAYDFDKSADLLSKRQNH